MSSSWLLTVQVLGMWYFVGRPRPTIFLLCLKTIWPSVHQLWNVCWALWSFMTFVFDLLTLKRRREFHLLHSTCVPNLNFSFRFLIYKPLWHTAHAYTHAHRRTATCWPCDLEFRHYVLPSWRCAVSCSQPRELCQSNWALDGCKSPQTQPREDEVNMDWCQEQSAEDHRRGPPLTLGGTRITSSDVVRVLGVLLTPCRWTSTLLHSVPSAFSSCDNYATSDVRSTTPSPH